MDEPTPVEPVATASEAGARRLLIVAVPAAVLLAHAVLASSAPHALVFGFDATRRWPVALRWAWLGLGLVPLASGRAREALSEAVAAAVAAVDRVPATARRAAIALAVAVLLVALRSQNFYLGDSQHLVFRALPGGLWVCWNEPLDVLAHAGLYRALVALRGPMTAEASYAAWSVAAGLLYVFLPGALADRLGLAGPARGLLVGTMLTLGACDLFFGYPESYTLCSLVLVAYLWAGARSIRGRGDVELPGLLYGLAVALHPLTLALGPSLLAVTGLDPKRFARAAAAFSVPVAIVVAIAAVGGGLDRVGLDRPGGADGRMLVPLFHAEPPFEHATLFSPVHLGEVFQTLSLSAPLGLGMLGLSFLLRPRSTPEERPVDAFLGLATAGLFVFVMLWNSDLGAARDWDLFAPAAFPLTAWAAWRLGSRLDPEERALAAVAYPLASALVTLPFVLANAHRAVPPPGWHG